MSIRRRRHRSPSRPLSRPPGPPVLAKSGEILLDAPSAQLLDEAGGDAGLFDALRISNQTIPSISRYRLVQELGEGGMGTVFLAHQISEGGIKKPVAVKMLKESGNTEAIAKLVAEAELLAQLGQGTIVEMLALERFELARPGGASRTVHFLVMEYVNGPSLEHIMRRHAECGFLVHPALVGFVLNKAVIALAEAHGLCDNDGRPLSLVHRDISPSNILFQARAGITKLADFGVAKAFATEGGEGKRRLVGKPKYMAPEQLRGVAAAASDIWALGVIGYETLTGFSPYRLIGRNMAERVENLRRQMEFPLRPPAAILKEDAGHFGHAELSAIIMECLQANPDARPTSLELNASFEGRYLYDKGLGPTNKTLAAYLRLLERASPEGRVESDPSYMSSDDAKVLLSTLHVEQPENVFRPRKASCYHEDFVRSLKGGATNPCLLPRGGVVFEPAHPPAGNGK